MKYKVRIQKRLLLSGIFVLFLFINIFTFGGGNIVSKYSFVIRSSNSFPTHNSEATGLQNIVNYIRSRSFLSQSMKIDFTRNFVFQHSLHQIDAEFSTYAGNKTKVLSMLWNAFDTKSLYPHLSCGPRAIAMHQILSELGIESRMVSIFTDNYDQVRSHTFLEVKNPETNKWELQDPDFNVYYVNKLGTRAATNELLWEDLDTITPISIRARGWNANNIVHLKMEYFEALLYMNHLVGEQSLVLINTDRFDPYKVYELNGRIDFFQFAKRQYRNPEFF